MEQGELEAIKVALTSFADFDNETDRIKYLKDNFAVVPSLKIYFRFSEAELKSALLEKEQQRTGASCSLNSFDLYPFHSNLEAESLGGNC